MCFYTRLGSCIARMLKRGIRPMVNLAHITYSGRIWFKRHSRKVTMCPLVSRLSRKESITLLRLSKMEKMTRNTMWTPSWSIVEGFIRMCTDWEQDVNGQTISSDATFPSRWRSPRRCSMRSMLLERCNLGIKCCSWYEDFGPRRSAVPSRVWELKQF